MKKKGGRIKKVGEVVEKMRKVEGKVFSLDKPFKASHGTLGQRAADNLTKWAGSWTFIIGFFVLVKIPYCNIRF